MNNYQAMVRRFHSKFGATIGDTAALRDRELRAKLILEEAVETCAALGFATEAALYPEVKGDPADRDDVLNVGNLPWTWAKPAATPDFVETIDGLCDLLYVTFGAAVAMGIDLDPFFAEVHRSNMAKDGGATRGDGKILKPEGWEPPNIPRLLRACTS